MKCQKCKSIFKNCWQSGKTYLGIDYHHNPPKELSLNNKWEGEIIKLCRTCHKNLHKKILEIIRKNSMRTTGNSVYWLWIYVRKKEDCIRQVVIFTKEWLKNGNTKTT